MTLGLIRSHGFQSRFGKLCSDLRHMSLLRLLNLTCNDPRRSYLSPLCSFFYSNVAAKLVHRGCRVHSGLEPRRCPKVRFWDDGCMQRAWLTPDKTL